MSAPVDRSTTAPPSGPPLAQPAACLSCFTVFNPNISHGEDSAEENVLWYYPESTSISQQLRTVGLCTAFTTLSNVFDAGSLQYAATAKHRFVIERVEEDFWFAAAITRPSRDATSVVDPHDDAADASLSDGVRAMLRRYHRIICMSNGTLTSVLAANVLRETEEENRLARQHSRPPARKSVLLVRAGRCVKAMLDTICREFSANLTKVVASPRRSFVVRQGLDYLPANAAGHLQVSCFARRLHNSHPGTIAHSVLVLRPNRLALTTLDNEQTATLLTFVQAAEGPDSRNVRPKAVFFEHDGKPIALRGTDASNFWAALHGLPIVKDESPSAAGANGMEKVASFARDLVRRLPWRADTADQGSTQVTISDVVKRSAVLAHDARTQCYIDDRLMGVICFTQGPVSLYCIVDDKFCQHELLRDGLIESVAAILLEESPMLHFAHSISAEANAQFDPHLEQSGVVYAYRNAELHTYKVSAHLQSDDSALPRGDAINALDRLKGAAKGLTSGVSSDAVTSWTLTEGDAVGASGVTQRLDARLSNSCWGFCDRFGAREFSFALSSGSSGGPGISSDAIAGRGGSMLSLEEASVRADQVRKYCLAGLLVE